MIHSARAAAPLKLPGWEIVAIIIGLVIGLILFGVIGGACETLICLYFKRPVRDDLELNQEDLDFGCQGQPSRIPEIRVIIEKETGDQASAFPVEGSLGRSGSSSSGASSNSSSTSSSGGTSRYSWQDEKGVTTEMFVDGTLPDAGPRTTAAQGTVSNVQYQGYQVQSAMRGYEGVHYQDPGAGLASNPPFVLHNEEDDTDYEDDVAVSSPESPTHPGFAVALSTDHVISPLTPEAQSTTWPHEAVSTGQAARCFADVDLGK
ncbi:hypothetical protein N0V93_008673 [Gnomoniopsis smithogilvyi]|uniref:Uncharacterized protein n=1 Tax=Gnomoniopsis smithogilvyi TaxID=1191159 RepID=A0A9W9CV05_9PEZI|nr:hypothetical protein N0V93_008673 [Gnomoniopsis smithogilvyi]